MFKHDWAYINLWAGYISALLILPFAVFFIFSLSFPGWYIFSALFSFVSYMYLVAASFLVLTISYLVHVLHRYMHGKNVLFDLFGFLGFIMPYIIFFNLLFGLSTSWLPRVLMIVLFVPTVFIIPVLYRRILEFVRERGQKTSLVRLVLIT